METRKPMLSITRRVRFAASHRLHNPELSDEENARIFGRCNNPNGHGHNYVLEVTVGGEPDPQTGMIMDLGKLKDFLYETVVVEVDHKHLNADVEFLRGTIPTAEVIVSRIWDLIERKLPAGKLLEVKLYETENNIATRTSSR
jgi:6-pyruvoyltetrahydropterin/6-carboxytetrahydropterin synthase